jgi:hypothetical protein
MNRDDRVFTIVRATEHLLDLSRFDLHRQIIKSTSQVVINVFTLGCPFKKNRQIFSSLTQGLD